MSTAEKTFMAKGTSVAKEVLHGFRLVSASISFATWEYFYIPNAFSPIGRHESLQPWLDSIEPERCMFLFEFYHVLLLADLFSV